MFLLLYNVSMYFGTKDTSYTTRRFGVLCVRHTSVKLLSSREFVLNLLVPSAYLGWYSIPGFDSTPETLVR